MKKLIPLIVLFTSCTTPDVVLENEPTVEETLQGLDGLRPLVENGDVNGDGKLNWDEIAVVIRNWIEGLGQE